MNLNGFALFALMIFILFKFNKKNSCLGTPLPYTFPVSIRVNQKLSCVGALLTRRWIVTICDCVRNIKLDKIKLRLGMIEKEAIIRKALEVKCSPYFKSDDVTPDKNVALIQIEQLAFSDSIRQAALPIAEESSKRRTMFDVIKRPGPDSTFSMNSWMEDEKFYSMKIDYKVRTWGQLGKIVSKKNCMKLKLTTAAKKAVQANMFCAQFFHKNVTNCSMNRGTLLLQGTVLWGLMNYKYAKCGVFKQYVPYVDVTLKENLNFIITTTSNTTNKNNLKK